MAFRFADIESQECDYNSYLVEGYLPLKSQELSTHLEEMSCIRASQGYNGPSKR